MRSELRAAAAVLVLSGAVCAAACAQSVVYGSYSGCKVNSCTTKKDMTPGMQCDLECPTSIITLPPTTTWTSAPTGTTIDTTKCSPEYCPLSAGTVTAGALRVNGVTDDCPLATEHVVSDNTALEAISRSTSSLQQYRELLTSLAKIKGTDNLEILAGPEEKCTYRSMYGGMWSECVKVYAKLQDFRDAITKVLQKRIDVDTCVLRALGVNLPRP